MKKQNTLLAIIGLGMILLKSLLSFILMFVEYEDYIDFATTIWRMISVMEIVGFVLIIPFFLGLYKNQK